MQGTVRRMNQVGARMERLAQTVLSGLQTGALADERNARQQLLQQQEEAQQQLVAVVLAVQQHQQNRAFVTTAELELHDKLLQAARSVLAITSDAASCADDRLPDLFTRAQCVRENARVLMLGARVFSSAASETRNLHQLGDAARAARVPPAVAAPPRSSDIGWRAAREGPVRANGADAAAAVRAAAPALPAAAPAAGPTWGAVLQPPPPPPRVRTTLTLQEYQAARQSIRSLARQAERRTPPTPPPPPPPPPEAVAPVQDYSDGAGLRKQGS